MDKIIQTLIDSWTKGVNTYTHNGSTWLIFTDSKRWVIELTDDKTLWYNYNFFKQIFEFTSLDVVENQQYITKWVEDNVINKVKDTRLEINITEGEVDDIIQDGVKETDYKSLLKRGSIEDTIENGVKETNHVDVMKFFDNKMDDTLENGIRLTKYQIGDTFDEIDDIIENGVKSSTPRQYVGENIIDKIIDNGVIETHREIREYKHTIDYIIQTGVKETHENIYHHKGRIDGVIKNGVKEVISYDEYKRGPINTFGYIDDIIKESEKINGTYAGGQRQSEKCKSVVEYGTKNPSV